MSPMLDEHSVLPINKRFRKLKNWDLPPQGYEDKTVQEVKALGKWKLRNFILVHGHSDQKCMFSIVCSY